MDDFAFMGIVFLFLVAFGKQPFPALVGGGSDGRLAFAALDDFQVKVRAWWHDGLWPPFSRRPGKEKAGNRIKDFLLGGAAGGRLVFSYQNRP